MSIRSMDRLSSRMITMLAYLEGPSARPIFQASGSKSHTCNPLRAPINILLLNVPQGIYSNGNKEGLLRR